MRWLSPIVLMFSLGACVGSLEAVSSGQVGCAESEVTISDDKQGWSTRSWVATCRGKRFFCSAHGGGENSTAQVSCKEEAGGGAQTAAGSGKPTSAGAQTPVANGGCQFDTQCKGERVCVSGACIDPPSSREPATPANADSSPPAVNSPAPTP